MSTKMQRIERATSTARQDTELLGWAKRLGHHGAANFIEAARQVLHMAITEDYAVDILSRAGFTAEGKRNA